MGLDMFAYKAKFKPSKEVDFETEIPQDEMEEIAYWRKHPDLHGHMNLSIEKKVEIQASLIAFRFNLPERI
jgi:hypothetical protein